MKKSLEQIIKEVNKKFNYYPTSTSKVITLEIAKEIRKLTIEEIANVAEADINFLDENLINLECGKDYEVYVLKQSILQLDKNSIEL